MNVALRRRTMSLEEFLEWEERQPARYEFDGSGPVAMVGCTAAHAAIQRNLITALTVRLRGKPCRPYGSELKIEVSGRIRYPDAFVVCSKVKPRDTVIRDPVVVFEILSDSTAGVDLIDKNVEYRFTPSIKRYVVLRQDAGAGMMFSHRHGEWATDPLPGTNGMLPMPEIDIEVPLAEIYEGIEFPTADES